ncbi:MAG: hypothetical protein ACOC1K_04865, partial [Nanoarchaeota archaeon]
DVFEIEYEPIKNKKRQPIRINWDSVDKKELYKALQLYQKGGMTLRHFFNQGDPIARIFEEKVNQVIEPPILMYRTRIKDMLRYADKLMAFAFQDESTPEELKSGLPMDMIASRIVLPDEEKCYQILDYMKEHKGIWSLKDAKKDIKDYIANPPADRPYKSIHVKLHVGDVPYSVQIRTYEMERMCEFDPQLIHRDTYADRKREIIEKCPEQLRKLLYTTLDIHDKRRKIVL